MSNQIRLTRNAVQTAAWVIRALGDGVANASTVDTSSKLRAERPGAIVLHRSPKRVRRDLLLRTWPGWLLIAGALIASTGVAAGLIAIWPSLDALISGMPAWFEHEPSRLMREGDVLVHEWFERLARSLGIGS